MASVGKFNSDQYVFDWTSRRDERCAMLNQLRSVPIAATRGRINGIIELLERLVLFARYLPDTLDHSFNVDAQVIFLAARIERRRYVSERTIRDWTKWAKELGLVTVQYTSREYGGHGWNVYTVHFARVMELLNQATGGRKRPERAEAAEVPADLGAEVLPT